MPFGRFQFGIPGSVFQEKREGQEGRGLSIQSGPSCHGVCGNYGLHLGQRKSWQETAARVQIYSLSSGKLQGGGPEEANLALFNRLKRFALKISPQSQISNNMAFKQVVCQ